MIGRFFLETWSKWGKGYAIIPKLSGIQFYDFNIWFFRPLDL